MPELRRFAPSVPIVLVGTKLGMQQTGPVTIYNQEYLSQLVICVVYVKELVTEDFYSFYLLNCRSS